MRSGGARLDLLGEAVAQGDGGAFKVEIALQVEPELGGGAEIAGRAVGGEIEGAEELFSKLLAGVDGGEVADGGCPLSGQVSKQKIHQRDTEEQGK